MFLHTFRKISLHVFTLFTSQDRNYFQNFCKKFFARIRPTMQFVEHLPIFDKQNAIAIAGRKASCVTMRIVAESRSFNSVNIVNNIREELESSAPVGSSASTMAGFVTIALAAATLCC